jgi:hypothetical protein
LALTYFIQPFGAGITQLAECQLPKLNVAGSIPVARSIFFALLVIFTLSSKADPIDAWAVRAGLEPSATAEAALWRLYAWFSLDTDQIELPDAEDLLRSLRAGDRHALVPLVTVLVKEGRISEARTYMESRGGMIPATRRDLAVALAWYGRYIIHDQLVSRPEPPPDLENDTYKASITAMLVLGWMVVAPDGNFHGDFLASTRDIDLAAAGLLGEPAGWDRSWIGIRELDLLFGSDAGEGTIQ